MPESFQEEVWRVVGDIPRGKVMTYGQVAEAAGAPRAAQAVGNAMRKAKEEDRDVPWQRVVRAGGFLSYEAPRNQEALLSEEGVSFVFGDCVDLQKHQWAK